MICFAEFGKTKCTNAKGLLLYQMGWSIRAVTWNPFDGSLMLQVNWPVVDTINLLSNKFAMGVGIKALGELKLNDSPAKYIIFLKMFGVEN